MKIKKYIQLAMLVDMRRPAAVFEEVKYNFIHHYPISEFSAVRDVFSDFNDLYDGKLSGYRACNTKFHDKIHITDSLLAISRLIDGYNIINPKLPVRKVKLALISTILHDAGYIQSRNDKNGTGAKYTLNHVARSVEFIKKYFKRKGFPRRDFFSARRMIECTELSADIDKIPFSGKNDKTLGLMLASADLLGRMASRTYLERLMCLYREFREGRVKGYSSEFILFQKTIKFHAFARERFAKILQGVDRYAVYHFRKRYNLKGNLYTAAIDRQIDYLKEILQNQAATYRSRLRRSV